MSYPFENLSLKGVKQLDPLHVALGVGIQVIMGAMERESFIAAHVLARAIT